MSAFDRSPHCNFPLKFGAFEMKANYFPIHSKKHGHKLLATPTHQLSADSKSSSAVDNLFLFSFLIKPN